MTSAPAPTSAPGPITTGPVRCAPAPIRAPLAEQDPSLDLDVVGHVGFSGHPVLGQHPAETRQLDGARERVEVALQVLRQSPDVVPVGVDLVDVERHVVLEQRREDVEREVDRVVVGEVVEHLRAEGVDHAVDEIGERLGGVGLLLEALDAAVGAGDDHAVLAHVGDLLDGERRDPAVAPVRGHQRRSGRRR